MKDIYERDDFWFNTPSILFKIDRLKEFYPSTKMSYVEKLNSIVRLSIYIGILFLSVTYNIIFLPILTLLITYVLYKNNLKESSNDTEENTENDETEKNETEHQDRRNIENFKNISLQDSTFISKPALYRNIGLPKENKHLKTNKCIAPTEHNPFMNVLLTDYKFNPNRKKACTRREDALIKQKVESKFDKYLYKNVDDIYNKGNSQRQYFTMPYTTIPNNQEDFAKWCYNQKPIKKEQGLIEQPNYIK